MRLVGAFGDEKQAFAFSCFLHKEGIENTYDIAQSNPPAYQVWIYEEDDYPIASSWYEHAKAHPEDERFQEVKPPHGPPQVLAENPTTKDSGFKTFKILIHKKNVPFSSALTYLFLLLCVALFLWNDVQETDVMQTKGELSLEVGLTPIMEKLIFDYPYAIETLNQLIVKDDIKSLHELKKMPSGVQQDFSAAENIPYWQGLSHIWIEKHKTGLTHAEHIPMFEKIKQKEIWRLFTPCLLHRDFLHILFNMAWLWILGKQIEERLKKAKMLFLILFIGVLANVAQYLMSGPFFLGFSGVVVGLAGFIWSRQKVAPWEGYPLQKGTSLFILYFVLAMLLLEIVTWALQFLSVIDFFPSIANTAHVVGGLLGLGLGRLSFFARKHS